VGVPLLVAKTMTYPERVNRYNIEKLRKCVLNGPDVHPGANMVRIAGTNHTLALAFADKDRASTNLKVILLLLSMVCPCV
jgi:DNA-directed RNA polymerase III subunit RPC1